MSANQVDYAALAKQYGAVSSSAGGVDYDALAKQHGAISSTPAEQAAPQATTETEKANLFIPGVGYHQMDVPKGTARDFEKGYEQGLQHGQKIAAGIGISAALPIAGEAVGAAAGGGVIGSLANAVTQGVGSAALAKAGGSSNTGAAVAGALGAAGPIAAKGLEKAAPYLENTAMGQYVRALSPTTAKNKAIANKIAPEMMDRGIVGSLANINEKAADAAEGLKQPLNQAYDTLEAGTPKVQGAGQQIVDRLESLKGKYMPDGKPANKAAVNAINDVQDTIRQYGNDISPKTLRAIKQNFDEVVSSVGGFAGADLTTKFAVNAQKAAGNTIRDILHSASPDIAALDKEISFQLAMKKITDASLLRKSGQEGGLAKSLSTIAVALGGAVLGSSHGAEGAVAGAVGSAALNAAYQVVRSPWWRTLSAVRKDQIAGLMANGNVGMAVDLMTKLGAPVAAQTTSQTEPTPNQSQQ